MAQPNYITTEGFKKLQDEFKELFHKERPKLVETIGWAAGNGDRSENADYIYGKRRLREVDRRLKFLRDRIEAAQVINPKELSGDKVIFGATITIEDENGDVKTYMIVGEDEIDTKGGRISWRSPMAKALLGKKVGDFATIARPSGPLEVEVLKVEF